MWNYHGFLCHFIYVALIHNNSYLGALYITERKPATPRAGIWTQWEVKKIFLFNRKKQKQGHLPRLVGVRGKWREKRGLLKLTSFILSLWLFMCTPECHTMNGFGVRKSESTHHMLICTIHCISSTTAGFLHFTWGTLEQVLASKCGWWYIVALSFILSLMNSLNWAETAECLDEQLKSNQTKKKKTLNKWKNKISKINWLCAFYIGLCCISSMMANVLQEGVGHILPARHFPLTRLY